MARIRPRLPSPATVIALVALFVSLGGVSYAVTQIGTNQIKNGAVTSQKIRNGTIRSRDVRKNSLGPHAILESKLHVGAAGTALTAGTAEGVTHLAVVSAAGTIVRGRGVNFIPSRIGTGRYQVIFNRDVRGCTYEATTGLTGAGTPGTGYASVGSRAGAPSGVFVSTFDKNGNSSNRAFHLVVFC